MACVKIALNSIDGNERVAVARAALFPASEDDGKGHETIVAARDTGGVEPGEGTIIHPSHWVTTPFGFCPAAHRVGFAMNHLLAPRIEPAGNQ